MTLRKATVFLGAVLLGGGMLAACSSDNSATPPGDDGGSSGDDGGSDVTVSPESSTILHGPDSSAPDTSTPDVSTWKPDTGAQDSGTPDSGTPDSGQPDAADSGPVDSGPVDSGPDVSPEDAGTDGGTEDATVDAGTDGQAEVDASDAGVDGSSGLICPVIDAGTDAGANLLQVQPAASSWDDSFGGNAHTTMTATTACGAAATHWVESGVGAGQWIKIYPDNAPYNAALQAGTKYKASITVAGTGTYHLDIWDGNGGSGVGDNASAPVTLVPDVPATFTVPFTMGTSSPPEFQVRVDGTGTVSVDVTLWDLTITAN